MEMPSIESKDTISHDDVPDDSSKQRKQKKKQKKKRKREKSDEERSAKIKEKFGYTDADNPFNDPTLTKAFVWKKKDINQPSKTGQTFDEIEKVRRRRKERELHKQEMNRIRAEEDRMRELENYEEWTKKEEVFHLQQQRQRSAIRLVEGREKPIDVFAKNLLLYGSHDDNSRKVKYSERYNALDALETLEMELQEPQYILKHLKLSELQELLIDIDTFYRLEKDAAESDTKDSVDNPLLRYWQALQLVTKDEIKLLETGGENGTHSKLAGDIMHIFRNQSHDQLLKMKIQIKGKLAKDYAGSLNDKSFDRHYWSAVLQQLRVHLARSELSELHHHMLVRQLERLQQRRENPTTVVRYERFPSGREGDKVEPDGVPSAADRSDEGGSLEEQELGHSSEIGLALRKYKWSDKYRPRKPRYFNRVRTGFDWNHYNKAHYDKENPPPKVVQGYKFNIFYPDLIDLMSTPQYFLEPADSDDFCIIRFHAGPPYEDVAFKVVNREWDKSSRRGFKCTFERGVLSLYFNFLQAQYRR